MASLTPRIDNLEGSRNLMINGNFDFWQRGTSFTSVGQVYTADRFRHFKNGTMVADVTRSTNVPTGAQAKFQGTYSHLYTVTTAQASLSAANYQIFRYIVEGLDYATIASGQSFRLQFWVRSSKTGTHAVSFQNSVSDRSYVTTYTINVANTWEKKTIDLTSDAAGTWLTDNGAGLVIYWILSAGTNYHTASLNTWQAGNLYAPSSAVNVNDTVSATWAITQVSLIPGSFDPNVDMPFKRAGKNIQQEFAMCQRYYEKSFAPDVTPAAGVAEILGTLASGFTTGSIVGTIIPFNVSKRASPSLTFYADRSGETATTMSAIDLTTSAFITGGTTVAETSRPGYWVPRINKAASYTLGRTYLLVGNWAADAEF